jgi:heat shock protein HslJ
MIQKIKNKKIILIILSIVWFIALGFYLFLNNTKEEIKYVEIIPQQTENQAPVSSNSIYNSWRWIQTTEYSGEIIKPNNSNDFILKITPQGKLISTTDCNTISASIVAHSGTINIGQINSTKKACPNQILESKYIYDLGRAISYEIKGDVLYIELFKNSGTIQFERVDN